MQCKRLNLRADDHKQNKSYLLRQKKLIGCTPVSEKDRGR